MSDGGVDAISAGSIIYQVKWSSKVQQNPHTWLRATIEGERDKISKLVHEKGISRYILMTSVAGTTTSKDSGSMQRLQISLDEFSNEFGIPVECWWQADIDAEVDAAPDSVKWSYQEMLAGTAAIRYLIFGAEKDGEAHEMRDTMLKVMASQWGDDSKIKFSQLDMDRVDIAELFIDVKAKQVQQPGASMERFYAGHEDISGGTGAVGYMLNSLFPLTYLLGVPGQGKSTLGQFLCQIHRAAIAPELATVADGLPAVTDPKLPLRVDLSDYALWLSGRDPFGEEDMTRKPRYRRKFERSLELFLVSLCTFHSGGRQVTVERLQSLLDRYPTLLVLDGLDEVGDLKLRKIVVEEIDRFSSRMGKSDAKRRFQILVTARPNASGLPEPDKGIFQTLELCPLDADLQREFVNRWTELNGIRGLALQKLRRTFEERTTHDHVAQLADNPMQLTILLFLISRKGDAVPVSRTPLYTDYMDTFMDREVNKQQIHRDHVPHVIEVTSFLGWHMQSGVESERGADRMTLQAIQDTLFLYFRRTGGPVDRAEELFQAVTDRFWALTSKSEGTFEFAVQPVREYFAAKFLAEWAGQDRRDPLPKSDVLKELIKRNYWLNTARFYAGFANPNELASLRYGLEEALADMVHPLQERVAVWTLLSDGIFTNKPAIQRDVTRLLTDDLTVRLTTSLQASGTNFQVLSPASGGEALGAELLDDIDRAPGDAISLARVSMLQKHRLVDAKDFAEWWQPRVAAALGTPLESAWLAIGGRFGVPKLTHLAERMALVDAESCRSALSAGVSPASGSAQDSRLLRSVLDGWCSEEESTSSSQAGNLLRSMRPFWFIRLAESGREGPAVSSGHFWTDQPERPPRSESFNALVAEDDRYKRLQHAARSQAMGQRGTTEPWQNAARELARLHGPCWLAADIAIIGAATQDTRPEGSFEKEGKPFGPAVDYGTLVMALRKNPSTMWWQSNFDTYKDSLSRRTWAFALLATADGNVVLKHLDNLAAVMAAASEDEFYSFATSTSRLGATRIPRRLGGDVLAAAGKYSDRLALVVSHFAAGHDGNDPLEPLRDEQLRGMASADPHNWSVARAVTDRLLRSSSECLMDALTKLGPDSPGTIGHVSSAIEQGISQRILQSPALYPGSWVSAAERCHSSSNQEPALAEEIQDNGWVPVVPRVGL
ncbi:NACHT domain-containing protein [Arthrobacter sp. NPDC057259]|uniref:NACHT domain-containing protein n=1 Tax=Arthrobacter sp. NPDC057259 TaxID=3346073 RepID=UPI0036433920